MTTRLSTMAIGLLGLFSCTPTTTPPEQLEIERGIYSEPSRVILSCVTPGCDTTTQVTIRHMGDRRLAIKRIILSEEARQDFTITPSQAAPFIFGVGSSFTVDVQYAPQDAPVAAELYLAVTYTDASPIESEDRVEPGELRIPLLRRLVGQPSLTAQPSRLSFGVVETDSQKEMPLQVENDGFGNVAVKIESISSGNIDVSISEPENRVLLPKTSVDVNVTWAPRTAVYLKDTLFVSAGKSELAPTEVEMEGTSIADARIAVSPSNEFNFDELPLAQQKKHVLNIMNQGGQPLELTGISVDDSTQTVKATLPQGNTSLTLGPLEKTELALELTGVRAGPVNATVHVTSNDAATPDLEIKVSGLVTEPTLQLTPSAVDFGIVPQGWVVNRPVEIKNTGFGVLTVKNILMVGGSSDLFKVKTLPNLPFVLERDQRITIDVEFRAETAAAFTGFVSIESDDSLVPFAEVQLTAQGGDCNSGCPIVNGTPSCSGGVCAVGSCNTGFYDADGLVTNGCECREVGIDPGAFCSEAIYKGTLKDKDKAQTNHTGIIPTSGDVDIIRFFAEDATNFLASDDFKVRVRLSSNDPGITMCVYRHDTKSHNNECYLNNEVCGRTFFKGGNNSNDSADFTVKVFRTASSTPTCTSYTVFMSNGL